jgi:hypothetical protein
VGLTSSTKIEKGIGAKVVGKFLPSVENATAMGSLVELAAFTTWLNVTPFVA